MVYQLTKIFIFSLLKHFVKSIKGVENLPRKGQFIVAVNHQGTIDGVLILYVIAKFLNRKTHFFTIKGYFTNFLTRFVFKTVYQCIKTNGSLKIGLDHLKNGEIVGLFPEGGRTRTGKMKRVERTGLGVLALISKAPVVPIGIKGSYEFWPYGRRFFRLKRALQLRIGKPIRFNKKLNKKNACLVVRTVMKKIAGLINENYPY